MEIKVKILNRLGLHARPASLIAQAAGRFAADISLTPEGGNTADAKSILSLLMLGAPCGTELTLQINGHDAEEEAAAAETISGLFASKFDED
ncbi:MAG: HPr family phosphocarrier protein [Lentisphaeria bacterium]|nr:HPr family phosphocarrier protein [Lentisphaeria bacterium]